MANNRSKFRPAPRASALPALPKQQDRPPVRQGVSWGLAEAINRRRQALRLTQAELAQKAEVSRWCIVAAEQAGYVPPESLSRILRACGLEVSQ